MSLRVVFMGTPDFAVHSLESIIEAGHNIHAAVVQPDKPKGRGMKLVFPPVKETALKYGIKVLQPSSLKNKEIQDEIISFNPDVIVVVAYGKILPKAILDIPRYGCINVHASLLPKYRGAAPIQWAIINGDKVTGVTTMYMDEGLDTGDMILKKEIEVKEEDTAQSLHDKLAMEGGRLLAETLARIEQGSAPRINQAGNWTYAPILRKEDGLIDWSKGSTEIRNLIRGLNPWPGAYTYLENGCLIKIWKVEEQGNDSRKEPGKIVQADHKNGLLVSTGSGVIKILELQPESCRKMTACEYLIGKCLKAGEKFKMGRS